MPTLALLRHGQSQWNLDNRFTGWVDVDLTTEGEAQARRGGELMKAEGLAFDRAYTSVLTRAIRTANIALQAVDQLWIPMTKDWRLNERHYGGLTGLNKAETAAEHGEDQVKIWRRSYDVPPPPLAPGGAFDFKADRRYAGLPIPDTESLKTTLERVLPYWSSDIAPRLKAERNPAGRRARQLPARHRQTPVQCRRKRDRRCGNPYRKSAADRSRRRSEAPHSALSRYG